MLLVAALVPAESLADVGAGPGAERATGVAREAGATRDAGTTRDAGATRPSVPSFQWEIPGKLEAIKVGDSLAVQGRALQLYAVRSSWRIPELRRSLTKDFERAKFFIPNSETPIPGMPLARVTAVDSASDQVHTALFLPEPDGSTTVFLGTMPSSAPDARGKTDLAPLFPGARSVVESNFEGARAVSFRARATAEEVSRFYAQTLRPLGYSEAKTGRPGTRVFEKGGRRLTLTHGASRDGWLPVSIWVQESQELPYRAP